MDLAHTGGRRVKRPVVPGGAHRRRDLIEPVLLLLGEGVARERDDLNVARRGRGSRHLLVTPPLARLRPRGRDLVLRWVLGHGRLRAVHGEPVGAEGGLERHLGQRLRHEVRQVDLGVVQVVDVRGARRSAEARRLAAREAVERLRVAQAQREVDVVGAECLAPPVLHELQRLLHQVAQPVLHVSGQRLGNLPLEVGDAHRLRDDLDRVARDRGVGRGRLRHLGAPHLARRLLTPASRSSRAVPGSCWGR